MEDLPLGRIAALVPESAVNDLPLGRTLMMIYNTVISFIFSCKDFVINKYINRPVALQPRRAKTD